ncbi:tyrosine aminotransferase [Nicotiana tabacum]|uniref:Tyrosine aminotransferase n=1 Tax=Nicotiana tabacum TaxID=4097 RepID=A0A1S4CI63_TOBAC|nr:tyrosine aminotransferase-like [Nicotiana tomentosiformis]XP_016500858.1 PREDICTED: tyrosine aminotransferase-like [Nicotiana tabacum]
MELLSNSRWNFQGKEDAKKASACTIRSYLNTLNENINKSDTRTVIPLSHGDPSGFPSFRTTKVSEDALVDALQSGKCNGYAPNSTILQARRSIAEFLSRDYPYELSPYDVHVTAGAKQAIEVLITALAVPGANILLPRPRYPTYEALSTFSRLEVRYYDLLSDQDWEVDTNGLEALADDRTVAMVVINPGNPCGNVYKREHLKKIAEAAKRLGMLVISDETYGHLVFGSNSFVPMGVFGEIVPILTIGSISKRWMVPGWRVGWIVMCDRNGILQKHGVVESIKSCLEISADPSTLTMGAITRILDETPEDFYSNTINLLRKAADICYGGLTEIPCFTPYKPQGSMFLMAKLNMSLLEGIDNDTEFCTKLAREESVIVLPGEALGLKNWVRVTFAVEISALEEGLGRIKAFCSRNAKQQ